MAVDRGRPRAEAVRLGLARALLDPQLAGLLGQPAGEHAHAVAAREDRVETLEQHIPGQPLEDALADLVGRLDVQRDPRDRALRAEPDHHAVEVRVAAPRADELAVRRDELERRDRRGQVAVAVARAVRRRRHRPGHRDVRQRGQVVQRQPVAVQRLGQVPVAHAAGAPDRAAVDFDRRRQRVERDELVGVRDVVEAVARAEHADARRPRDDLTQRVDRARAVHPLRAVDEVAGPVGGAHATGKTTGMETMSPLDASFLHVEDAVSHMHIGSVGILEGPAPSHEQVMAAVAAKLPLVPRYRQRVRFPPLSVARPVWVDDPHFNLDYHVRHTALPAPGGDEQLRNLVGRVMAQKLDRSKPLWEMWVAEGLDEGRWALVNKIHHCMVDGVSGTDLMTVLFDAEREPPAAPPAQPWAPGPEPSTAQIVAGSLAERATSPYEAARTVWAAARGPRGAARPAAEVAPAGASLRA